MKQWNNTQKNLIEMEWKLLKIELKKQTNMKKKNDKDK